MAITMVLSTIVIPVANARIDAIEGWSGYPAGGAAVNNIIDTTTYFDGNASMKFEFYSKVAPGVYYTLATPVELELGKTYYVGCEVKAEGAKGISPILTLNNDWSERIDLLPLGVAKNWTHIESEYIAQRSGSHSFRILIEDYVEELWIDNAFCIDVETGVNLLENGTFDTKGSSSNAADDKQPVTELNVEAMEGLYNKIRETSYFDPADMEKISGAFKYIPVYRNDNVVLDGIADEWDGYPIISMPTLSTQFQMYSQATPDVQARARFAFDDENLYVYIAVEDNAFTSMSGLNEYWQADSLQFAISSLDETYGQEVGINHDIKLQNGAVYSSYFTEEQVETMKCQTIQEGVMTYYEFNIPWNLKFEDGVPQHILFDFLVNDNDGAGRLYATELSPGIAEGKTNVKFPILEMRDEKSDWYAWLEQTSPSITKEPTVFDYYIVNNGDEKVFTITHHDGTTEEVTVPANTGYRGDFSKVYEVKGSESLTMKFKHGEDEFVSTATAITSEKVASMQEARELQAKMVEKAAEIKTLLDKCSLKGIATDYELAAWRVMDKFAGYILEDINNLDTVRVYYTDDVINELYTDTKATLEAYLAGTKTPKQVPKYVTSDIQIDGKSMIAMTETADGTKEERPVFFVGYGHFNHASDLIPQWSEWGMSTIQQEIGPYHALSTRSPWIPQPINPFNGGYEWTTNPARVMKGDAALRIWCEQAPAPNQYSQLLQKFPVQPGRIYEIEGYSKGNFQSLASIAIQRWKGDMAQFTIPASTDWQKFSFAYTAGEGVTEAEFSFLVDGWTEGYIDEITIKEQGKDENLLVDGGFEIDWVNGEKVYNPKATRVQEIKQMLQACEDYNMTMDLLLSPHYMFGDVEQRNPMTDTAWMKYNPNAPEAKEMIEKYLRGLIPDVAGYKSLKSITLSNEPEFQAYGCGDYYLEDWREYLKGIYGTIEALNVSHEKNYTSFDEVQFIPIDTQNKAYDYKIFNDQIFAEWHEWVASIIKEYAPDIPLSAKIMSPFFTVNVGNVNRNNGTGYQHYAKFFELNGFDHTNYYEQHAENQPLVTGYNSDYHTSMRNAPTANTEDHILIDRSGNHNDRIIAPYVGTNMFQGGVHARAISDIWSWQRTNLNYDQFWGLSTQRPDVTYETSVAAMDLNRLSYEVTSIINEDSEVGLLLPEASFMGGHDPMAARAAYEAYEAAMFNGKKVVFLLESQVEKMQECSLVIVPATSRVPRHMVDELKKYIDNGGRVVVMGKTALTMDDRQQEHPADLINYIKLNSAFIDYTGDDDEMFTPSKTELVAAIRQELTNIGLYNIRVVNAETGEAVTGIEIGAGVYDGDLIINLANYYPTQNVKVYRGNELITEAVELRSGDKVGEVITVEQYRPILLKVGTDNVLLDTYAHWAEEDIKALKDQGVIEGVTSTKYKPNHRVTRAEFLALAIRASKFATASYQGNISDVSSSDWYASVVATAVKEGIIASGEAFRPNDDITREEMCQILVKCYEKVKGEISANVNLTFADTNKMSDTTSVKKAVNAGLMQGRDESTFAPLDFSTRAEAAVVIGRFLR